MIQGSLLSLLGRVSGCFVEHHLGLAVRWIASMSAGFFWSCVHSSPLRTSTMPFTSEAVPFSFEHPRSIELQRRCRVLLPDNPVRAHRGYRFRASVVAPEVQNHTPVAVPSRRQKLVPETLTEDCAPVRIPVHVLQRPTRNSRVLGHHQSARDHLRRSDRLRRGDTDATLSSAPTSRQVASENDGTVLQGRQRPPTDPSGVGAGEARDHFTLPHRGPRLATVQDRRKRKAPRGCRGARGLGSLHEPLAADISTRLMS